MLRNWRDKLLQLIQPQRRPSLLIAVDPDGLLQDEQLTTRLDEMNVELFLYDDPIYFRFAFETRFRSMISKETTSLLIRTETVDTISYDILHHGQVITFSVNDLFPGMNSSVIRQLSARDFDELYPVYETFRGSDSPRETLSFLLRHVYKIPYDLIDTEADVYQWLLSLHARYDSLPFVVEKFLIQRLEEKIKLHDLPIREWVRSSKAFYNHLQGEWQRYLCDVLPLIKGTIKEDDVEYNTDCHKPSGNSHPFSKPDVRRWVNDLFVGGHLQPITCANPEQLPAWTHVGVKDDPTSDQQKLMQAWLRRLQERLPEVKRYQDWQETARLFGQMKHAYMSVREHVSEEGTGAVKRLEHELDHAFTKWMLKSYQGLPSLPHLPVPVMVHHIPHFLAARSFSKVALIVLDGMSMVQWAQIKQDLEAAHVQLAEHSVFSWVPTLTSVSRQALFSGQMPLFFADSLWTTNKEKRLWFRFWEDRGVSRQYVVYERNLGQEMYDRRHYRFLTNPRVKVVGLIVNTIDKLTHGAIQGHEGMQAELALWLQKG